MDKIATINRTKKIIEQYKFNFSKSLGQNFLIDHNILTKIIIGAGISEDDQIIEIGPGIGSLTQYIAERAKSVVAVEIDSSLIPILKETLHDYSNVEIINEDVLKIDLHQLIRNKFPVGKIKMIANLPYYVTTPIIMRFLEGKVPIESMTVMVQKEVGERMQAKPGKKDYGALSVAVQYYCQPDLLFKVPPSVFIPQPKVESIVINLKVLDKPKVTVEREDLFFHLVKDSFGKRRKTLLNALNMGKLQLDKNLIKKVFQNIGIDEKRRGETLSIEEFAKLANEFAKEL